MSMPDTALPAKGLRVAVIGSGISGAAAAFLLGPHHQVTLFESAHRLGGHANSIDLMLGGSMTTVDTGFIVYNTHNYPQFNALLAYLDVASQPSDMSFAVSLENGRIEYSGSGLDGLFGQRRNLLRPGHWRMLLEILRFYRQVVAFADAHDFDLVHMTLAELLVRFGCSHAFTRGHILPMAAAIWSTPVERILEFPAASFIRFFENHGLFRISDRPQWRTIAGGSRCYVTALNRAFRGRTRLGTPVESVIRSNDRVLVKPAGAPAEEFDRVVIATHADQALAMLVRPQQHEKALLSAFDYVSNKAVVHRDPAFMPRTQRCWSSWNYLARTRDDGERLLLSYWMNRLQGLDPGDNLFVTLNPHIEPEGIIAEIAYEHPLYNRAALAAQQRLADIQGLGGIYYCGAHFGHGFHEDGLVSAIDVARRLGARPPWESRDGAETALPFARAE